MKTKYFFKKPDVLKYISYLFAFLISPLFLVSCGEDKGKIEIPPVSLFTLTNPGNDDYDVELNPTFTWENAKYSTSYSLFVADNPNFTGQQEFTNLTSESYTVTTDLEYNTTYYWKVLALGQSEKQYAYSSVFKFITLPETGNFIKFPWTLIGGTDNYIYYEDYLEIEFFVTDTYAWFNVPEEANVGVNNYLTFEYQADNDSRGCVFSFWSDIWVDMFAWLTNPPVYQATGINPYDEALWTTYTYDLSDAINAGWSKGVIRFDFGGSGTLLMRNLQIVCELE